MARRGFSGQTFRIRTGSDWDAQGLQIVRLGAPIALTTMGLPAVALGLRGIRLMDHAWLLEIGMGGFTVLLTTIMWKISSARKGWRKWLHIGNIAASMGWLTAAASVDHLFWPVNGLLWTIWCLMAIGGSLAWILTTFKHTDNLQDLVDAGGVGGPSTPKYVDMGVIMRAVAGAPVVRQVTQAATPAFPVLGKLHEHRAIEAPSDVVDGEVVEDAPVAPPPVDPLIQAKKSWIAIQTAWKFFTTKTPDGAKLRGAPIVLVDMKPNMVKTKIVLKKGFQLPNLVDDARQHLAVILRVPVSKITRVPQSDAPEGEVHLTFTFDTAKAKEIIVWPGAPKEWTSIVKEMVYGTYEDGRPATMRMAGVPKLHIVPRHLAIEGITRGGKSNVAKIAVVAGLKQYDVVDWAVDPVKAEQTWGPIAPAVDWISTSMESTTEFAAFLLDYIEARFRYLGQHDYDQWEDGCGLPFHRIWVEEGNLVIPLFGDDFENAARIALSAGVMLVVSAQTWHHGDIPTPFRALFGDKMTYGFEKEKDAFLLSEKLVDAGACPDWGVKVPGKHYWMRSDLPLEDQAMTVRAFHADKKVVLSACRELAAEKHERVIRDHPDWVVLLKSVDANGVYANRLTGTTLRAQIDKNIGYVDPNAPVAEVDDTPAPSAHVPSPRTAVTPGSQYAPPTETETDHTMDYADDADDYVEPAGRDRLTPTDDEMRREMKKLGGNADWLDEIGPDTPGSLESMMPHPDEVLKFDTPPGPDKPHTRRQVMDHLIATLAHPPFGPGKAFEPHDVAEACRNKGIRRSRSWYRGEISTTLLGMGVVRRDRNERYTVALDILTRDVQTRVERALADITD